MGWFSKKAAPLPPRVPKPSEAVWYEGHLYRVMSTRRDGVVEFANDVPFGKRYIQKRVKMGPGELVFDEQRQYWLAVNRTGPVYNPNAEQSDGELRH